MTGYSTIRHHHNVAVLRVGYFPRLYFWLRQIYQLSHSLVITGGSVGFDGWKVDVANVADRKADEAPTIKAVDRAPPIAERHTDVAVYIDQNNPG